MNKLLELAQAPSLSNSSFLILSLFLFFSRLQLFLFQQVIPHSLPLGVSRDMSHLLGNKLSIECLSQDVEDVQNMVAMVTDHVGKVGDYQFVVGYVFVRLLFV